MDQELEARLLLKSSMVENRLHIRDCLRRLLGDSREGLEEAVEAMADLDNRRSDVLHLGAVLADIDACQILIHERCHDVNAEICGVTPLIFAANGKNPLPVVKFLFKHGADPNKKCGSNTTPLHITSEHDHYETTHLLLRHGAAIDSLSGDGETPCHVAVRTGNTRMLMLLLDYNKKGSAAVNAGAPMTPLILASESGLDECIQVLLNAGADANICDMNVKFSVELAALGGFTPCVQSLLPCTIPLPDYSNWSVNEIIQQANIDEFFDALDEFEQAEIHYQVPEGDTPTRSGAVNVSRNTSARTRPPRTDPQQNTTGNLPGSYCTRINRL